MKSYQIALVDDHVLVRNGLAGILNKIGYQILFECSNGLELIDKLKRSDPPDLIMMDINMPQMDGYETTLWLRKNYPLLNVLALSMYDSEEAIIKMIRHGAKGYILKDIGTYELKQAIDAVIQKGFHYTELVTGRLIHSISHHEDDGVQTLSPKQQEFLKLVCTEMTYKEIAMEMHLSPRTVDGYREDLFEKLNVKSRVGLVLFAIKQGIVQLN